MKLYSGIDEAGLGPILGPFCAASVTFSSPKEPGELLKDLQGDLFTVDDSKKIFKGKKGLEKLETTVLTFYSLINELPNSLKEFIPSLTSKWYEAELKLPVTVDREVIVQKRNRLIEELKIRDVSLIDIKRNSVTAANFNKLLDIYDNKSIAIQKIMDPLILNVIKHGDNSSITVDKQGGRKFYREYLEELTGREFYIIKEENNCSTYNSGGIEITFRAKADSTSFPVALSSMFSKYMREISMSSFNNYWTSQDSSIKRTAGYYTDGVRFLNDLDKRGLTPELESIRRKK